MLLPTYFFTLRNSLSQKAAGVKGMEGHNSFFMLSYFTEL